MKSLWQMVSLLALFMLATIGHVKGQAYSSDLVYYVESDGKWVLVLSANGSQVYAVRHSITGVKQNMRKSEQYYENHFADYPDRKDNFFINVYQYSSGKSTSKYDVYWYHYRDTPPFGSSSDDRYIAISKDMKTVITWYEEVKDDVRGKLYYMQIDKENFLPKSVNYDFLE